MSASELLGPAATVAGVCMSLAPCLQVHWMLRSRSAAHLSLATQAVIAGGAAILLAYTLSIANGVLIAVYATGTCASGASFVVSFRLRRQEEKPRRPSRPSTLRRTPSAVTTPGQAGDVSP